MNTERTRRYYDKFSETYSDERREGYFGFINAMEASVLRDEVAGKCVLEVGCGTGLMLELVSGFRPGALTGVDLSLGMLSESLVTSCQVICGSAMQLPFKDSSFDVVYSFKVLSHVPDLKLALSEVMRVLAPEGVAYLELYNPYSLKGLWDRLRGAAGKVHLRHYSESQVRNLAPDSCDVTLHAGARIFGPTAGSYLGVPGHLFRCLDSASLRGPFRRFAGYQIYRLAHRPE